jgi:hypothetical protein
MIKMTVVQVNKPTDPNQLKILFPNIKLALDGIPVYGKVLYTTFSYPLPENTELVLDQTNSGYNLDTHLGLLGFMQAVEYLPAGKMKRFIAMGKEAVLDPSGRVVSPQGIFHTDPNVIDMYTYCSTLRVSNKVFMDEEVDAGYLLDVLEAPLYQRLWAADQVGHEKMLQKVLQVVGSYYDPSVKFSARRDSKGVSGFDRMTKLMNTFNVQGFKEFSLSGDMEEDVYVLLSLFG